MFKPVLSGGITVMDPNKEKLKSLNLDHSTEEKILKALAAPRYRSGNAVRDRKQAVHEARDAFVSTGLFNNISEAFALYNRLFLGDEFPAVIDRESKYNAFQFSIRPACPECGRKLYMDLLNTTSRNQVGADENGTPYKTCWVCANADCGYIGDWSTMDVNQWRTLLMKEGA